MLKKCFVPSCSNNSQDSPSKLFLSVPKPDNRRKLWFKSVGANYRSSRSVFCCEDHFNLPIDAENWVYFKTVGGRIRLHEHVVPHLNLEANSQSVEYSQLSNSEKKLQQENIEQMKIDRKQDTVAEPFTSSISQQLFHNTREDLVKTTESPIRIGLLIKNNKCFLSHHNDKKRRRNSSTCVKNQISDDDNFNGASKYIQNSTACGEKNYTKHTVRIKKRRKSPICIKPDFSDDDATIPSYESIQNSPLRGTEKFSNCMNNNDSQNDEPNLTISSVEFAQSSSTKDIQVYKMSSPELEKKNSSAFVKTEFSEYDEHNFEAISVPEYIESWTFSVEELHQNNAANLNIKNPLVNVKTEIFEDDRDNFEIVSIPENIQDSSPSIEIINEKNADTVSRKKQSPISLKIELEMNADKVKTTKYLVCVENEFSKDDVINSEYNQNSYIIDNLINSEIDVKDEQSLICVKNEVCEEKVNNLQLITDERIKLEQQLNTELIIKDENLISCEETYICGACDKIFYNKTKLKLHKKSHQKFMCDICDKIFTFKHHLTTHKRTHNREKSYACDFCAQKFTQKASLIIHQRIHTGEKPYSCDFCDKTFAKKSYLTCHRKSHTGDIPYKCGVCEKYFSQRSTLRVHEKQHTSADKRPFSCDVCDKTFKRDSLVVHKIQHIQPNYGGYHGSSNYSRDVV